MTIHLAVLELVWFKAEATSNSTCQALTHNNESNSIWPLLKTSSDDYTLFGYFRLWYT